jgi:hypothetical protein
MLFSTCIIAMGIERRRPPYGYAAPMQFAKGRAELTGVQKISFLLTRDVVIGSIAADTQINIEK